MMLLSLILEKGTNGSCCSLAKLCPTLWDPMDCSMRGFPVLHYYLKLAQVHVLMLSNHLILC